MVIRKTLFGDYELLTEENYLKDIEDGNEVKKFEHHTFTSYDEVEEFCRNQEYIPTDCEVVRL